MMGMCPVQLEQYLVLDSDRYGAYPMIKSAIRNCVEQMRYKSESVQINEVA